MSLLFQVVDKLQALNDEFERMTTKKKELEHNIDVCSQKLVRAEKLIGRLGGEKDRWTEAAKNLGDKYVSLGLSFHIFSLYERKNTS